MVIAIFAILISIVSSMTIYAKYFVPSFANPLQLILSPILIGLLVIFGIYLNKTVFGPIKQFVEINKKLASGDLNVELPELKTGNEIGKLNQALKTTLKYMKEKMTKINQIVELH